jgi:hypothetical protein
MLEKDIEAKAKTKLEGRYGAMVIKLLPSIVGLTDRLVIGHNRVVFFLEFKKPGEQPRKIQQYIHNKLRGYGFGVYTCTSVQEAEKIYQDEADLNLHRYPQK